MKKVRPTAHLSSSSTMNEAGPDAGLRLHLNRGLTKAPGLCQVLLRRVQRGAEQGFRAQGKSIGIVCPMWHPAYDWDPVSFWNPSGSISVHHGGARSMILLDYDSRASPQTCLGKGDLASRDITAFCYRSSL